MAKAKTYWNLKPRYTGGSPAAVWDEKLALHVAAGEKTAWEHALAGAYGENDRKLADAFGLGGIVEETVEKGGKWHVRDVLTNRRFVRERKPAKKIHIGEILTRYEDATARTWEGSWRVLNVMPWGKKNVLVKLDDHSGDVFLYGDREATTECDITDAL